MAIWTKVLAAASGGLLICCNAAGPEAGDPPPLTTDGAHAEAPSPAPPPPASPLPSGLNLPGDPTATGPSPTAPTTPSTGGRVLWATSGATLLKLASDAPSKVDARAVSGLAANEQLVGLSFRKNGALYAVGSTSRLFTLASATASASAISFAPFAEPLAGTAFGFDFDPVTDLARVTSNTAENIRVEAAQGTVTNVDGTVHYMAGDPNVAAVPHVVAVAYTATGTGYAIDTKTGVLARIVDSYSGQLQTIGALGVIAADIAGFDIAGKDAFAALRVGATTSLYAVDLTTGKVTLIGTIGDGSAVTGLAIQP